MAQEGIDKLLALTESRYLLSMVAALRAAQLQNGIPSTLSHNEYPKTRNTVSIALRELLLDKGIRWGAELPSNDDLQKTHETERRAKTMNYSVQKPSSTSGL